MLLAIRESDRDELAFLTTIDDPAIDPEESLAERIAPSRSVERIAAIMGASALFTVGVIAVDPRLVVMLIVLPFAGRSPRQGSPRGAGSIRIAGLVVCWISYTTGPTAFSNRSLITFTEDAFSAFEELLHRRSNPSTNTIAPTRS